ERVAGEPPADVEDEVADGDPDPGTGLAGGPEHPEREVLDGEVAAGAVGGFHPAPQGGVVRPVGHSSPSASRSRTGSSNEHEPNEWAKCRRASRTRPASSERPRQWARSSKRKAAGSVSASTDSMSRSTCQANTAARKTLRNPCITARGGFAS